MVGISLDALKQLQAYAFDYAGDKGIAHQKCSPHV